MKGRAPRAAHRPVAAAVVASLAVSAGAAGACRGGKRPRRDAGAAVVTVLDAAPHGWPELADLPRVEAITVIELPVDRGPPASVVGPVVVGDVAVIGTSRMGFVALDWSSGRVAWRRAAGAHLAAPVPHGDGVLLVADCERAPLPPTGQIIVGCWRVVSSIGADLAAGTLSGAVADVTGFVAARGAVELERLDDHRLRWTRGDRSVVIDVDAGRADAAPIESARVIARHRGRQWRLALEAGAVVSRDAAGAEQWRTRTRFAALIGVVPGLAYEVPMVRVVNLDGVGGRGVVDVVDIEVTGTVQGHAGTTVPGIQILGHAFRAPGATALAVRLDATLQHDFISAHDAHGALAWVWPLPERVRVDPVGLAITDDAVLVFHDGDRLTVLPAVSPHPTAAGAEPGSGSAPSRNSTP